MQKVRYTRDETMELISRLFCWYLYHSAIAHYIENLNFVDENGEGWERRGTAAVENLTNDSQILSTIWYSKVHHFTCLETK